MMNFAPEPMKHKINVIRKLHDKLIFYDKLEKFLCLHSVLLWIVLHWFCLVLELHYLFDVPK